MFSLTGPTGRHGRSPFSFLCSILILLVTCSGIAILGSRSLAADRGSGESRRAQNPQPPRVSDVLLARSILLAIDADPELRDVNLVVSVVDGVAVIGGPVMTQSAAKRAGEVAASVPNIKEVRNKCFVQAAPDPLLLAMSGRAPVYPRSIPMGLPAIVTSPRPGMPEEPISDPLENTLAVADPAERSVVTRRPSTPGENVLLAPVGLGGAVARPSQVAPAVPSTFLTSVPPVPPPAMIPGRAGDVLVAASNVRKLDRRYAGLTVELRDGALVIAGTAVRASDAWDFAQEVRRIPGVARVVVGQVESR